MLHSSHAEYFDPLLCCCSCSRMHGSPVRTLPLITKSICLACKEPHTGPPTSKRPAAAAQSATSGQVYSAAQGLQTAANVPLAAAASGGNLTASSTVTVQSAQACLTHISLIPVGAASYAASIATAQQLSAGLSVQQVRRCPCSRPGLPGRQAGCQPGTG